MSKIDYLEGDVTDYLQKEIIDALVLISSVGEDIISKLEGIRDEIGSQEMKKALRGMENCKKAFITDKAKDLIYLGQKLKDTVNTGKY